MNIYRLIGDLLHLLSILILFQKIRSKRSCAGISLKSIELYEIVFVTRYLDLFTNYVSLYNSSMKVIYIASTAAIIYLMRVTYKRSYDRQHDNAWTSIPIAFAVVCALCFSYSYEVQETLWTFSIFLEAVAMVPQLWMLWLIKEVETLTADYTATLGLYRAFYLLNWIYRYYDEGFVNWIVTSAGILQTLIYIDFLYYYIKGYVHVVGR
jgi:ER lumen protein retaining receptor